MSVYSFPCPHCSARLRLRDRRLIGRTIDCPDCRQPVVLHEVAHSGDVGGQRVLSVAAGPAPYRGTDGRAPQEQRQHRRLLIKWLARAISPVGVAWVVAAGLSAALLVWWIVLPSPPPSDQSNDSLIDPPIGLVAPATLTNHDEEPDPAAGVKARFSTLFERLAAYQDRTGSWPRGSTGDDALPRDSRFSWLAVLAARASPTGPQPHWNRAWNDPVNERFVRQRQDTFLNPLIGRQTGNDRYPTSHFVGITGYGAESDSLPAVHPRAGIFGSERSAAPSDVADGLANTMLIAGVDRHLGSWAAAGPSTLRGFTAEPFINGPDGFGTGQTDGMFVMMADGSVRFLSSQTDPKVIRRLAAKADGLPVEGSAPAHDLSVQLPASAQRPVSDADDRPELESGPVVQEGPIDIAGVVAEIADGADHPIEVPFVDGAEVAEEQKAIDIDAALNQPIARFDQSTPVPAHQLLRTIEEMAAVKIDTSQLEETMQDRLRQPIRVTLDDTTVGDILRAVMGQLELTCEADGDHLRVVIPTTPD